MDIYDNYKIKRKKKKKMRIILSIVLVFIFSIMFYYFKVVCPIVVKLSEEKIRSLSTIVISESVGEVMNGKNLNYNDIVHITYSSENKIKLIEVDTVNVNMIIRDITKVVQKKFDILSSHGINIALGTFTGIPFLYGVGPDVKVKLVPVGTINTDISSSFNSEGINQTLHKIYFNISGMVGMILPAQTHNFVTELDVLICESVIVGDVPEVYLKGNII